MSVGGSHDGRQPPSLERQAVALAGQVAMQMFQRFRSQVPLDELRSLTLAAALLAARQWDGRGSFPKFTVQRVRWAVIDELRRQSRRAKVLDRAGLVRMVAVTVERSADITAIEDEAAAEPPPAAEALAAMFRRAAGALTVEMDAANLLTPPAADPHEDVEDNAERMRVRRAVAALPETEREVVEQHGYHGATFEEIAEASGLQRSTVFSRYTRALERLRQTFEEKGAA